MIIITKKLRPRRLVAGCALAAVAIAAVGVLIGRTMLYIDGVLSLRQLSVRFHFSPNR